MTNSTAQPTNDAIRGPLRISANGRYFLDSDGQPFFWLGDTQWQLCRDLTLDEASTVLAKRQMQGFNVLQVMLTGVGDGTRPNIEGQTPWLNHDPATPNDSYFQRVDAIVQMAQQHGLYLMLYLCHNTQRRYVTRDNARAYARWVAQRYRHAPNILWAFVTEVPIADYLPLIRELAEGVQEGDGGAHLISYHPDPVRPALSSGEIHTEPWLAFNIIQTWGYYEGIWGMVTRDYHRAPAKPVIMAEGAYEDEDSAEYSFIIPPLLARQQAYWSYLSGGFHSYGHTQCWKLGPQWKAALDAPGARQMSVLRRELSALDWWMLTPDQWLFASQSKPGTTLNTAAHAADGRWLMAYLSSPCHGALRLDKLNSSGAIKVRWVDPRNGDASEQELSPASNTNALPFETPSGWEDALLVVERVNHEK